MNNTNNSTGYEALHPVLAQLLLGQGAQVSQNANDILNGTGVGQQLQGREAYLSDANAHAGNTLSNLLHNNPGGYVSNAAPLQGNQNANVATDNSMTLNALLGVIGQASGMQNNAVNAVTNSAANQNDNFTIQRGQNLQSTGDPNGNTNGTGNGVINLHTQNIINGTEKLSDVPAGLRPRVAEAMTKMGYDPAQPLNSIVNDLKNAYSGLAGGNNLGNSANNGVSDLLNTITGGIAQTPREQQLKTYRSLVGSFEDKLNRIPGANNLVNAKQLSSLLPSEGDTDKVAQSKFQKIQESINNAYHMGGVSSSKSPDSSGGVIKVGKYTVQY